MATLYPLTFYPIYKSKIWGGNNIQRIFNRRDIKAQDIGESWELSDYEGDKSIVSNGEYKEMAFNELISRLGADLVGTEIHLKYPKQFPLLSKVLDCNDDLSIQIHPDDAYAKALGQENGKSEGWYIIDAQDNASIIAGYNKDYSQGDLEKALEDNHFESLLNYIPVSKGDFIFIPAGLTHALGQGIVAVEVQQTSDTTFRLYDYNRPDQQGNMRELHIEKGMKAVRKFPIPYKKQESDFIQKDQGLETKRMIVMDYFQVDILNLDGDFNGSTDPTRCEIYTITDGSLQIMTNGQAYKLDLGQTFLLPAALGSYQMKGKAQLLKAQPY